MESGASGARTERFRCIRQDEVRLTWYFAAAARNRKGTREAPELMKISAIAAKTIAGLAGG